MGTVKISRFNKPLQEFVFVEGQTLDELCTQANINLEQDDVINTSYGDIVEADNEVEEDEVYSITKNYKNGSY